MKILSDANFRRDLVKLACVFGALLGAAYLFVLNPTLSTPTLFSLVVSMMFSPMVAVVERRGYPRALAIIVILITLGGGSVLGGLWGIQSGQIQWRSLKEKAPTYFDTTISKLKAREAVLKQHYPILADVDATDSLMKWGKTTGEWFVDNGAKLIGNLLTWMFLIPLLTFFLLHDGPSLRRKFFQLVPNRYFELVFGITHDVSTSISDYIRAKLVEALLLGLMVTIGLTLVGSDYTIVLGIAAGVTNILPYVGPIFGAVPAIIIASLDTANPTLIWWVLLVYLIANLIDTVFVFPVVVGKLVDLHPMILVVVVMVGGQYYGLIGMLISIPIASAIKVILQQIYSAVYDQRQSRSSWNDRSKDLDY